jgi:hypothetical protein
MPAPYFFLEYTTVDRQWGTKTIFAQNHLNLREYWQTHWCESFLPTGCDCQSASFSLRHVICSACPTTFLNLAATCWPTGLSPPVRDVGRPTQRQWILGSHVTSGVENIRGDPWYGRPARYARRWTIISRLPSPRYLLLPTNTDNALGHTSPTYAHTQYNAA